MLHDENFLYIAAEVTDDAVWCTIRRVNETIYFGNDFEVFVDPDGANHNYYEWESNVNGAYWELTMEVRCRRHGSSSRC